MLSPMLCATSAYTSPLDYKFHTGEPIPLDGRLAHRLSYTNEIRFFFRLPWQYNDLWPGLPRLQESFLAGCALCGVIRTKLQAGTGTVHQSGPVVPVSEIIIRAEYGFEDRRQRKPAGVIFDYQIVGETQWHRTAQQPSFVLAAPRGNTASRQFRGVRELDSLTSDNQTSIGEWINECKESHQYCKTSASQSLPTRLIDVQLASPTLVSTRGKTGTYATLSYCWGLSPDNPFESMYTTTEATIQSRMGGMNFNEIPKTLQDAILVTRAIGLKYLWIDALCIIQDSKSDVEHEIQNMDSVYGNCEIVICATNGTSSKTGFLSPRCDIQPLVTVPFVPCDGGKPGAYGFYDTETFPARNDWQSVERSEWNQRAWTFQERIVPPRVLHFGKETVRLECRTSDFSELGCLPRQVVIGNSVLGNDYRHLGVLERLCAQDPPDKPEIYETYYKFACEYSKRKLSFETDRLSAFSAVVTRFKQVMESENLYGIWAGDIWRGLIWSVWGRRVDKAIASKNKTSTTQVKLAWPSWSWYSCPNAVSWIHSSKVWKSASAQSLLPQGNNSPVLVSFSTTLPGSLTISAVLREAEMEVSSGSNAYIVRGGDKWGKIDLDDKFEIDDNQKRQSAPYPYQAKLWLLQLRNKYQIFSDDGGSTMCWAAGLALEHAVGDSGPYRRIGIFSIYSQDKWEELFEGREQTQITLV
ncbi:hypothetical protein V494_04320 [Pseudogymnoascus sp. VKM F-4513 (FW-928)]|nr:hypothetical protein V494_04320 [Pseudogymnoascus sp. VKM F-4513 (FW-928)]